MARGAGPTYFGAGRARGARSRCRGPMPKVRPDRSPLAGLPGAVHQVSSGQLPGGRRQEVHSRLHKVADAEAHQRSGQPYAKVGPEPFAEILELVRHSPSHDMPQTVAQLGTHLRCRRRREWLELRRLPQFKSVVHNSY